MTSPLITTSSSRKRQSLHPRPSWPTSTAASSRRMEKLIWWDRYIRSRWRPLGKFFLALGFWGRIRGRILINKTWINFSQRIQQKISYPRIKKIWIQKWQKDWRFWSKMIESTKKLSKRYITRTMTLLESWGLVSPLTISFCSFW